MDVTGAIFIIKNELHVPQLCIIACTCTFKTVLNKSDKAVQLVCFIYKL